jgi:uncharacterized membrane protein
MMEEHLNSRKSRPMVWTKNLKLSVFVALLFLVSLGVSGWLPPGAWAAEVSYPVTQFDDGKAKFFDYKTPDGITVKYFILKSSDGVIRAAFDACDVCWPSGKGYQQKGDFMVCRNCGRQFASTRINDVTGGCNPAALTRRIENGKVIIQTDDIAKGKKYFDFKGAKR